MKYPLDQITFNETASHLVSHTNMQTALINKLLEIVVEAMDASEYDDDNWYKEAKDLLADLEELKTWHESRRWNETNYQNQMNAGAYKAPPMPIVPNMPNMPINPMPPGTVTPSFGNVQFDLQMDMKANKTEEGFGPELTEEDLDKHFNQKREKKKKEGSKGLNRMSIEEIEDWEKKQDNSNDIYKISARVDNLARGNGAASLTPQGKMLTNTYSHVLKAFYDFAEKIEDKTTKINLIDLIRSQEGMPGTLISAAGAGVKK